MQKSKLLLAVGEHFFPPREPKGPTQHALLLWSAPPTRNIEAILASSEHLKDKYFIDLVQCLTHSKYSLILRDFWR